MLNKGSSIKDVQQIYRGGFPNFRQNTDKGERVVFKIPGLKVP